MSSWGHFWVKKYCNKQGLEKGTSQGALEVKSPPANATDARDTGSSPGPGRPLQKGMAARPSIPAWGAPGTEEPGGLQSTALPRGGRDWSD